MRQTLTLIVLVLLIFSSVNTQAQNNKLVQNIRGIVTDRSSGAPLSFITVGLINLPNKGVTSNEDGTFVLENVPIGRYDLSASSLGYETRVIREILLTSAKEVYLEIQLKENTHQLGEVLVTVDTEKDEPLNKMALLGGHLLSIEDASRYAGGMDDPARLVSSFAGVSPSVGNNGISVHGNAPSLLLWKLEDVEIPNPNHFAEIATLGGGFLSSLSNNVLGNSDFFKGAFPSEYNNAVSGVFDMKLRNGNNRKYQHTAQLGVLGIDIASEGPFSKKHNSSYIFNYRLSSTSLGKELGVTDQMMDYQDLNFKVNLPTKSAGIFTIWGTGLKDNFNPDLDPVEDWEYNDDSKQSGMKQTSMAAGVSHRYFFDDNSMLKTTLAATYLQSTVWEDNFNSSLESTPWMDFENKYTNLVFTSFFNKKYSANHTNKSGITVTNMSYDMDFKIAPIEAAPLEQISKGDGNTNMISAYTSSLFNINNNLSATLGINGQYLSLNNDWTIEPRASIKWQSSTRSSFGLAYGLHSRMEKMDVYFVKTEATGDKLVNKDLDFTKTHHLALSYNYQIGEDMNLKVEPFFQYLFDVPVVADSSYSVLNRTTFYLEEALINKGNGRNYGIDLTFEKYMTRGLYYMLNASIFDSKYKGGDDVWYNTKFNRGYIVNGLIGKEWAMGSSKQNVLGVNLKLTLQGGDRYAPVDEAATMAHPTHETQYDESKAYSEQLSPMFLMDYTVSFRMNRRKISHLFFVKGLNATGYKEYFGHEYNIKTKVIEPRRIATMIPNLAYRIDF